MNDPDLLKLAQLCKAEDEELPKKYKLDLVKKINVHYSIPTETYRILHKFSYIGYNCLHFAATMLDYDCIQELLNRGADIFKQGTQDHKTPVHIAMESWISECILREKLQSCQVVDTLLSAHVTSRNSLNPKCKNGISHLHIASLFNCTELVAFLLKAGESVNQITNTDAFWPGYTPLHFAARYSRVETAQCLINNGANMVAKDAKGISPLHILIDCLIHRINYVSLDRFTVDESCEEEIKKLETIVRTFIENRVQSNVLDDTGLTVFHIACTLRDTSIAAQLLKDTVEINKPVNMDSKFWAGWTPLHFAACSSTETVKLLVQRGADITVKNAKQQTPLDICLKRYFSSDVHSILSVREEFGSILFSDNETNLLDLLLVLKSSKDFDSYLESLEDPNISVTSASPILPGYSLLHLALSLKEKQKFQQNIDFIFQDHNCPQHVAELFSKKIRSCLGKGCSIAAKNFDGLTPIHLAFSTHCSPSTLTELLFECERDAVDPDNLSLLHIACAVGHLPTVEKLIGAQANMNAVADKSFSWYRDDCLSTCNASKSQYHTPYRVNAKSTPLHVAVAFVHMDVIQFLLDSGADAYAQDSEGYTPIHLSLTSECPRQCKITARMIFKKVFYRGILEERTSRGGLTHLHVAAYTGQADFLTGLILKGGNANCVVGSEEPGFLSRFAGKTPLELALEMPWKDRTVEALVDLGADTYANGLIHYVLGADSKCCKSFCVRFYDRLKLRDDVREPIEPCGMTLLHVACDSVDVDWAEELLAKGADVNAQIQDDEDYNGPWKGYTPLHVLALRSSTNFTRNDEYILKVMLQVLLKRGADMTIAGECGTALHVHGRLFDWIENFTKTEDFPYDYAPANVDRGSPRSCTTFDKLFQVNPVDSVGKSFFHAACARIDAVDVVEKFLDSGVDVNHSTSPFQGKGFTALHFVVRSKMFSFETVRLLVESGANLNAEDHTGNTALHMSVYYWSERRQLFDYFKRHGADFNAKNIRGETPADVLMSLEGFTLEKLQYLLANGSSITVRKNENIHAIMKNAVVNDRMKLFETFVNVCNIKDAVSKDGYNPIQEIVSFFLESDGKNWNMAIVSRDYLDLIQLFVNEGCDVNQRNEKGETPLHTAISHRNSKAVSALLQAGADINKVKSSGFYMEIRRFVTSHVEKMKFLGLRMSATCDGIYASKFKETVLIDVEKTCKRDLEKAKIFKITNSLTANVFLSESEAVVQYLEMGPDERQDVDMFFKRVVYLNDEFPELAGLMICQYKKAAWLHRMNFAKDALAFECGVNLPSLCLEGILNYFTVNELEYLIQNPEEASIF